MMHQLHFLKSDIFTTKATLIINPVNIIGVMGAGLAKRFKAQYPLNFDHYRQYCLTHDTLDSWRSCVYEEGGVTIYNFPSKVHYKDDAKLSYIRQGLVHLAMYLNTHPHSHIAIPPIGAGLGGLSQKHVLHLILYYLRLVEHPMSVSLYQFDRVDNYVKNYMAKVYDLSYREQSRFTGVGSRDLPKEFEARIRSVACNLSIQGFVLYTGDAQGADTVFWNYFDVGARVRFGPINRKYRQKDTIYVEPDQIGYARADRLTAKTFPSWHFVKRNEWAKELHTRNVFQLLGSLCDQPTEVLVCYTPDGVEEGKTKKKTGGTGQAIRLAQFLGIPVFNLYKPDAIERLFEYLGLPYKPILT